MSEQKNQGGQPPGRSEQQPRQQTPKPGEETPKRDKQTPKSEEAEQEGVLPDDKLWQRGDIGS